jgi:SAM-dependent methyltransferase
MSANRAREARIRALDYDYASQPKLRRAACDLCGGSRLVTLSETDRYGFPAPAEGCRDCGLVFLNPVLDANAYRRFYAGVYRPLVSAYHGRRIDAESIQAEQRVYAAECAAFLEPWLVARPAGTLLDIGGSTGVVASELARRFGSEATVVDPAPVEAAVARRLGIEVIEGAFDEVELTRDRYDLVTLCQTVDHLPHISDSLARIRAVVRDGGMFFVDFVGLEAGCRREGRLEDVVKVDHPFYLTESTMRAYLEKAGLEALELRIAADRLHVQIACTTGEPRADFVPREVVSAGEWPGVVLPAKCWPRQRIG